MSPSEKEEKNMWLTLSVSVSMLLIIRCAPLGVSPCLSEFLFPICKMGLIIALTSQGYGSVVCRQVLGPSRPSRFSAYYLPSFFPGWGGAGEDTGSGTRGLTDQGHEAGNGPGWGGGAKGWPDGLLACLPAHLSFEAWPSLPAGLCGKWWLG